MSDSGNSNARRGIEGLREIIGRLRGEGGCPWDREQTLETLKQYLIEESYEVLDAIDSKDPARHAEELGDLLLQVLLQAAIRKEKGEFSFDDVVEGLSEKLVRRHPHVFGDVKVSGTKDVLKNWEAIKSGEKKAERKSVLDGIPRHFPALHRAQKAQSRAARVGFDWVELKDVIAKVDEEVEETKQAISRHNAGRIRDEIGDLLFSIVNLSRHQNINAEECLDAATNKFAGRFRQVEQRVMKEGRKLSDCSLAEMDAHWEAVKNEERQSAAAVS
jgi:tetrapyrrole methylase family protein / MazG family protein